MKKKVLILASVASMIEQFNMNSIKILQELGYEVQIGCNFKVGSNLSTERTKTFKKELQNLNIKYYQIDFARTPFNITNNLKATKQVNKLIKKEKYDFIHCHTPTGGLIGRIAALIANTNTKVLYTAHGFHFFKGAPLINWLAYYPVEWVLSFFTDVLITINQEDYALAKSRLHAKNTEYIPGVGIDIAKFQNLQVDKDKKREELGIPAEAFVLLSVGELNENKNHKQAIKALAAYQNLNIYYLIAGKGQLEVKLKLLAQELGIANQVHFLGYRADIPELMQVADVFIHPSHREGLPVSLMEAMASALPCIASNIRGNADLLKDDSKPFLCHPTDHQAFATAITKLYNNKSLATHLAQQNQIAVQPFTQSNVNKELKRIYNLN